MGKLSISNLAWPEADAEKAIAAAGELGFDGIEIAPARCFPGWPDGFSGAERLRKDYERRGLAIPALQGILFGAQGVELFDSDESRGRLMRHLRRVAELAGALGAGACVYGAPKSRDPGDLPMAEAMAIATGFFGQAAGVFEAEGTCLAFEANAPQYGCRFITHTREAADLVAGIAHPGIGLQIDTGTVFLTGEAPEVLDRVAASARHFHVSEPDLAPLGESGADHAPLGAAMRRSGYKGWISVEMRETEDWRARMKTAAKLLGTHYRRDGDER